MPSTFLGIYSVLYDYAPQSDQELSLKEGDLLYVLEKSEDDDWWKAKKRTLFVEEEEPEGLVPCNYIAECEPIGKAKATYDYTRQTQEELSFTEDAILDVYDTEDPDWTLVGYNGEYGFAPANYIEIETGTQSSTAAATPAPAARARVLAPPSPASSSPAPASPGLAPPDLEKPLPTPVHDEDDDDDPPPMPPRPQSIIAPQQSRTPPANRQSVIQPGPAPGRPARSSTNRMSTSESAPQRRPQYRSDSDSDDGPSLPMKRPPHERRANQQQGDGRLHPDDGGLGGAIPPGYRSFPVMELIGKKKHAALLALGPDRIILIPDKSSNPRQEWSIEHMMNYSYEGKHVFIDVNYPTKAMDLHAGSKEVAAEIYAALADITGAARANEGLREVISATDPRYKRSNHIGTVLWDFLAGGEDEVSVNAGDEVTILDDKDHDWWMVKRTVNGKLGVMPSNYIKRGRAEIAPSIDGQVKETKSQKSTSSSSNDHSRNASASLPSGVQLPVRTTSLAGKRSNRPVEDQSSKSKPDASKLRMWTDRSGTFKVEAQFLGCRDDKIHLHKSNGVKIAVPVSKMSVEDLEYVERRTGISLDDDKPLMSRNSQLAQQKQAQKPKAGITIEHKSSSQSGKKEYDWFDFFLGCGIDLGDCQRYALHFQKESMDETFLPELTASSLRNLGLKEGDIIRATKFLDNKYGRNGEGKKAVSFGGAEVIESNGGEGASGGLFSGPGGVLRNNTGRKGRPAPAIVTSDTVDPSAFQQKLTPPLPADKPEPKPEASNTNGAAGGFDDDAWAPKPTKQPAPQPKAATPPPPAPAPAVVQPPPPPPMSAGLQDLSQLSLSTPPLQPTVVTPPPQPQPPQQQQPQLTGFNPQVNQFSPQPQGFAAQQRQRPQAPQATPSAGSSLIPPPPQRPISAPQTFQSSPMAPAPMMPQMTGLPLNPPSVAPPGQMSMADQLHEMRMQQIAQQQQNLQAQQAALFAQMTGAPRLASGLLSQPTGYQVPQTTGFPGMSSPQPPIIQAPQPISGAPGYPMLHQQATGFQPPPPPGMHAGVNAFLPQPLVPQPSGLMVGGGGMGMQQPLKPQATGPAPQIRFGAAPGAPKLAPQPTGKRANLSQATPDNPFGF